ncbi:MAG: hypothetical protein EBU42_03990 [Synechococcus sp.]|nr:hypothetical protein [Synechococcus sp.]
MPPEVVGYGNLLAVAVSDFGPLRHTASSCSHGSGLVPNGASRNGAGLHWGSRQQSDTKPCSGKDQALKHCQQTVKP